MRVPLALALALSVLFAGCSRPTENAAPMPSSATSPTPTPSPTPTESACPDEGEANAAAPLVRALQEEPDSVAARLAQVVGARVEGAPDPRPDGALVWADANGSVTVRPGDGEMRVSWERPEWRPSEDEARALLADVLRTFGVPEEGAPIERYEAPELLLVADQRVAGERLVGARATVETGSAGRVEIVSLRELAPGVTLLPVERAEAIAEGGLRCFAAQASGAEPSIAKVVSTGLQVKGASLARSVVVVVLDQPPAPGCDAPPSELVLVDALSGKWLGMQRQPCGELISS